MRLVFRLGTTFFITQIQIKLKVLSVYYRKGCLGKQPFKTRENLWHLRAHSYFNPIQDWGWDGGKKAPPTSFSPVTTTNVGLSPQNLPNISFNPFVTLVQNFKVIPSVSPKLVNLNQDHPSKKVVLLVKCL